MNIFEIAFFRFEKEIKEWKTKDDAFYRFLVSTFHFSNLIKEDIDNFESVIKVIENNETLYVNYNYGAPEYLQIDTGIFLREHDDSNILCCFSNEKRELVTKMLRYLEELTWEKKMKVS